MNLRFTIYDLRLASHRESRVIICETRKSCIVNRDLCESHWSAGILPAWGAISPEKRRLEASAPVVVRPFAEVSNRKFSAAKA
jgi:hypothetical protein